MSSLLKELMDSAGDIQFGDQQEVELKGLAGLNRVCGGLATKAPGEMTAHESYK